jgi:hypothetical protein
MCIIAFTNDGHNKTNIVQVIIMIKYTRIAGFAVDIMRVDRIFKFVDPACLMCGEWSVNLI